MLQADKLRAQQELERLQQKYIGTGHPDTTSWEWKSNILRDTYSSLVGHPPMLSFLSLAQGEPASKTRFKLLKVRLLFFSFQVKSPSADNLF